MQKWRLVAHPLLRELHFCGKYYDAASVYLVQSNCKILLLLLLFFFLESQFILKSVVIHLAECYAEGVLQCLEEGPTVGPLRR
jgi:hypothetical protein